MLYGCCGLDVMSFKVEVSSGGEKDLEPRWVFSPTKLFQPGPYGGPGAERTPQETLASSVDPLWTPICQFCQ